MKPEINKPSLPRILLVCAYVFGGILCLNANYWGLSVLLVAGGFTWIRLAYPTPIKKRIDLAAHNRKCAIRNAERVAIMSHQRYEDAQQRDPEGKRYSGPPPLP